MRFRKRASRATKQQIGFDKGHCLRDKRFELRPPVGHKSSPKAKKQKNKANGLCNLLAASRGEPTLVLAVIGSLSTN
jgi:hypothetical protein